jgi:hypothetical protein
VFNVQPATEDDTFEVGTVSGDIQLNRVSTPNVNAKTVSGTLMMSGPLAKSGNYGFTSMSGDMVLVMPSDASFKLNAKVSERHSIVSDFQLKFLNEPAAPPTPPAKKAPEAKSTKPIDKEKDKTPKAGPIVAPIVIGRPAVVAPYALRRITAVCGSGDATISVASFAGPFASKRSKPQKATKGTKIELKGFIFCAFCAFLWLTLLSQPFKGRCFDYRATQKGRGRSELVTSELTALGLKSKGSPV